MVIKTEAFPQPGETLLGGEFFLFPGGKGANQAVAAARLGGDVTFIAKIGNDIFGENSIAQFRKEGIVTDYIHVDDKRPSGVALITVDAKGENTIVVAAGSNGTLGRADVEKAAGRFTSDAIVLMQLEIPLETVIYCAQLAKSKGATVILNPAPARALPNELLANISIITPNRTETETLSGIKVSDSASAESAARWFRNKGINTVIITLGRQGAFLFDDRGARLIEAPEVKAVDSTAAGDIFNGALAVGLAKGQDIQNAVRLANRAAALSVTRMGAQASAPFKHELESE